MMSSPNSLGDPCDIFQQASEAFRSALSDEEKCIFREFSDGKSMLAVVEQQAKAHPVHKTRLTSCCKKINTLAVKLSPFFDVVSIFVQSHPEYSGIAWGAIRLVFQLGTNYISFLEKFSDMLENMGNLLPAYERYVREIRARAQQRPSELPPGLLKALGYIYSDLIQFCFEACKLLSKKRSGIRLKGSFVNSLLWKPFDIKFDTLLRRYKEHRELMDLEMRATSHTEAMEASAKLDDMIARIEHQWEEQDERAKDMEWKEIERRLHRLKEWINPPTWTELFEDAQNRRAPESAEWFLTDDRVGLWCSRIHEHRLHDESNILFVQGKPGFGKTTLCTVLIEHLRGMDPVQTGSPSWKSSCTVDVVFFYFDKQRRDSVQPVDAFRAVLAQLLPTDGGNKEAIDVASILWSAKHSGQLIASGHEVKSILRLLPRQRRPLVMFFDGIDECVDQTDFLQSLEDICSTHENCSVVLFSRPTVKIPRRFMQRCVFVDLQSKQNLEDIRAFLRLKITDLVEEEVLAPRAGVEDIVTRISNRANGMFLWVTLLVEYLQSPALTIRQRSEAVDNLNRLEGLDALYSAILRSLVQRSPEPARTNVRRAFQWVAWAYRPLHVNELKYAISIPMNTKMDESDVIPDFARSLSSVTGALLEISSDMTVRFIHLSALEYFIGSKHSSQLEAAPQKQFITDEALAHFYCASCCVSYLYNSVPAEPLGGSAQATADKAFHKVRYPFLDYAAEFWSAHLLRGVKCAEPGKEATIEASIDQLVSLVSAFLSDQRAITMWIEASWMFNHPPQIGTGPEDEMLSDFFGTQLNIGHQARALLSKALVVLKQLANDLKDLNASWADALRATPNEIWEPSVPAFTKSQFWTTTTGAEVTALGSLSGVTDDFICVKSQVSSSGHEIGLIKVCLPLFRDADGIIKSRLKEDCKVCYEIWSLTSKSLVIQSSFDVSLADLAPFIHFHHEPGRKNEQNLPDPAVRFSFEFPAALSSDLRRAAILHHVLRLPEPTIPGATVTARAQVQRLGLSLTDPKTNGTSFRFDWLEFLSDYCLQMSASGEYLLVMHTSSTCVKISTTASSTTSVKLWLIRIYRDQAFQSSSTPNYVYTASLALKALNVAGRHYAGMYIVFHPYLPVLALAHRGYVLIEHPFKEDAAKCERIGAGGTLLWDFSRRGVVPLEVSQQTLTNIRFSNDGTQIYGKSSNGLASVDVPRSHSQLPSLQRPAPFEKHPMYVSRAAKHSTEIATLLSNGPVPTSQVSNSVVFGRDQQGMSHVSKLEQVRREGGLVLQRLREDGVMTSETLARLPKSVAWSGQAVLLNPFGDDDADTVRVVLNQAMKTFESHPDDGHSRFPLPAILERQRDTITTFVGKGTYSLEDGMNFSELSRKRLGWDEQGSGKRQRQA